MGRVSGGEMCVSWLFFDGWRCGCTRRDGLTYALSGGRFGGGCLVISSWLEWGV